MIWTVDSDVVVSLLVIKFFIANNNGLLVWYSVSLKLLCLIKKTYLLALVNLATTGSFVSVSMSKLWVPKSMVKLSSMLYLAVIQQLAFLAMVRAGASKLGITTP